MVTINGTDTIAASRTTINNNFGLCAPLDNPTFQDAAATSVTVKGGAAQGSTKLTQWQDSTAAVQAYVTANGNVVATMFSTQSPSGASAGYVRIQPGDASHTGFIEWKKADGTRLGYVGNDAGDVTVNLQNGAKLVVAGGPLVIPTATPASAAAAGAAGQIAWDADYVYVCTAANTWKRAALATW